MWVLHLPSICQSNGRIHYMAVSNFASLFTGAAPPEKTQAVERPVNTGYRILLVDDEPNVLKALLRVFRQENYTLKTVSSGQEALVLLGKEPFHLMISDYMMPGMTGSELLKQVKAIKPEIIPIMLHKKNLLSSQQVQELYRLQQQEKKPIIKLLLERDWVSEKVIHDILRKDLLVEEVSLAEFQIDAAVVPLIPRSFCERQLVVPLRLEGKHLLLALADPMDMGLLDDLRFVSGLQIQPVMASVASIKAKLAEMYGEEVDFKDLETLVSGPDPYEGIEIVIEEEDNESLEELLRGTDEPPAIRLVNAVILEAIRLGASDIHIQPRTKSVMVRYRIDGVP